MAINKKEIYESIKAGTCFSNPFTDKLNSLHISNSIDTITSTCDSIVTKIKSYSNATGTAPVPPAPPVVETSHWVLLGVDTHATKLGVDTPKINTALAPVITASNHNSGKTDFGGGGLELLMAAQAVDGFKKKMEDPTQYEATLYGFSLLRESESGRVLDNINTELTRIAERCTTLLNTMKKVDTLIVVNAAILEIESYTSMVNSISTTINSKFAVELALNGKLNTDISVMAKVTAVNNLNSTLANAGVIKSN